MKIEIWSDIACPWCYIGKKRFEKALQQFPHAGEIEVEWKSFLLNPHQKTDPEDTLLEYLSREKGFPAQQVEQMMEQVARTGATENIDFQFDKVVVANTVRAHALLQLAKEKGVAPEVKMRLLQAYFEEFANIDTPETLLDIAQRSGLDREEIREALTTDAPFKKVERDLREAQALGIQGVPFFVVDRKYGISGAQETATFLKALEKAWPEWRQAPADEIDHTKGDSCSTEGHC